MCFFPQKLNWTPPPPYILPEIEKLSTFNFENFWMLGSSSMFAADESWVEEDYEV